MYIQNELQLSPNNVKNFFNCIIYIKSVINHNFSEHKLNKMRGKVKENRYQYLKGRII